jgi:acetoin utilization deacetylase AcuC-like enzyme
MLKVAWSPVYAYALPEGHRFPMVKYELLPEQLLYEGTLSETNFFQPTRMGESDILLTHTSAYWESLINQTLSPKAIRKIGFPMTEKLVDRGRYIAQGTFECAKYALEYGCALNIAGGTHHAFADRGEGFCVFNDIALASNMLLSEGRIKKILVIDLDVHQGNGTASIFKADDRVFTLSLHGEKNYPVRKENSNLDIGLPDGMTDRPYLDILHKMLEETLDKFEPEFIFYLSGVDVLGSDLLGRLNLSMQGCKERDRIVLEACHRHQIPVAVSMGGGYSAQLKDIIEAHANTYRLAMNLYG